MNKKQSIIIFVLVFFLLASHAVAGEIVKPLRKSDVGSFLKRLNKQKILVTYDKSLSEDKIVQYEPINNSFMLEGSSSAQYFLYKADINNDGVDEYVSCFADGSGNFFDIDAIYKEKNGKLIDILDEIKIPMREIVRVAEKGDYDLIEGYVGLMNGSIKIERDNSKTFFTLETVVRDYDASSLAFNPQESFKMLWDKGVVKLVEHYIGDEDIQKSNRLDKVCELLQSKDLSKEQKAELLYEKSYIMLTTFWVSSLRTGTESLLEAIELTPKNNEYKDFLCQAYDNLWKDKDFKDGDEFSKDFQALKEKVRIKVEQYRKDWDGKEDQFIEVLRATQGERSEAELHQAIGYWLLEKYNQWERATFHFKKAVELDPKLYMSWYNLGLIDIDSEVGYNYFKKATEVKLDFSEAYYWMAYYRCRYREDKKAIPLFKKYLEVAETKKDPEEQGRIKVAKEALADLLAGKEGASLSNMRKPKAENK